MPAIADSVGVSVAALKRYKVDSEPRYCIGVTIVQLWVARTGNPESAVPTWDGLAVER